MTGGGVDRSVECTGSINAMIAAFECVHDVRAPTVVVGAIKKLTIHLSNFTSWTILCRDGVLLYWLVCQTKMMHSKLIQ